MNERAGRALIMITGGCPERAGDRITQRLVILDQKDLPRRHLHRMIRAGNLLDSEGE